MTEDVNIKWQTLVADTVFTVRLKEHWPEESWIQVARVVVALDAFLFSHHDIQTIVLCAGGRVLMYNLTQVTPKCCVHKHCTSENRKHWVCVFNKLCSWSWLTDGVAPLYGVGGVVQGREAGVGPAALELHKQGFFGWAGEVPRAFEGAVSATRTLFFLKVKVEFRSAAACVHNITAYAYIYSAWGCTDRVSGILELTLFTKCINVNWLLVTNILDISLYTEPLLTSALCLKENMLTKDASSYFAESFCHHTIGQQQRIHEVTILTNSQV